MTSNIIPLFQKCPWCFVVHPVDPPFKDCFGRGSLSERDTRSRHSVLGALVRLGQHDVVIVLCKALVPDVTESCKVQLGIIDTALTQTRKWRAEDTWSGDMYFASFSILLMSQSTS